MGRPLTILPHLRRDPVNGPWQRIARTVLAAGLVVAPFTAARTLDVAAYDASLCERAQRLIVNADPEPGGGPFGVKVQRGEGNGFHTIQMDVDATTRTVVIAASTGTSGAGEARFATHVACKMVDRDRVNDVLGLALAGSVRSCRDVNEATYQAALGTMTAEERQRFLDAARPLTFADDYIAATGGEWLPAAVDDFIEPLTAADGSPAGLQIRAPSVRVPWNPQERNFFQGTRHCKLITLAAMRRWMIEGAAAGDRRLFPRGKAACLAPSSTTATAGSCLFYFAPAAARFCEDYSGSGWTAEAARAECGKRHASAEALRQAANRYAGAGGSYDAKGCAERKDAGTLGGTCVFHCNQPDEALWRPLNAPKASDAGMMARACDLYIP